MKIFDDNEFKSKKELTDFLIKNHNSLVNMKMDVFKKADEVYFNSGVSYVKSKQLEYKANEPIENPGNEINVLAVINSSNWLDSYMDVHIPGLWKKSISENKKIKHLQEHQMRFDHIISDKSDLRVFTKNVNWTELGFNFTGQSECLMFDSIVRKERNEFMFNQYALGHVDNHSVGMRYVKLVMCIDDESAGVNYEAWEKYYPMIINPEMADKKGYFWAVTEAKVIEGSAVPLGANQATPTLNNNKTEPSKEDTQQQEPFKNNTLNYDKLINNLELW